MKAASSLSARLGILPPRVKGQALVGYIYEAAHMSGWPRAKDLVAELANRQTIQPPWTVPTSLRLIHDHLQPVFASAEQILEEHTCLPAHLPFVSIETREQLLRHVLDGALHKGIGSMVGLANRDIHSKPEMALCPECLKDDAPSGRKIWHREHQLAGLGYCPTHGCPLLVGCGSCHFSQRLNRIPQLPTLQCGCGQARALSHPALSEADGVVITRMSRYAAQLLDGAMRDWHADDVTGYFHQAAKRRGYSFGSRFKTVELQNDLREAYSRPVLERLNATMDNAKSWLPKVFGREGASCVLGRNLLLLDYFDRRVPNSNDLAESRRYMSGWRPATMGATRGQKEALPQSDDKARIERYIAAHPGATRSEVLKALGRVVMRVRAHESEWYERVLSAKPKGRQKDTQEERDSYLQQLDKRTAAHVERRCVELLGHGGRYPHPITRAALLKGCTRGNQLTTELLESLPNSRAALENYVESPLAYKRRFALTILRRSRGDPHTIGRAHIRTGLSLEVINELNALVLAEETEAKRTDSVDREGNE